MSNSVKLTGVPKGELEIKRMYLPGVVLKGKCACGKHLVRDFSQDYLSYPTMNKVTKVHLYCGDCDDDTVTIQVRLNVSLTLVDEK